jgi:DNA-binding NarL/FixJ family response regulator
MKIKLLLVDDHALVRSGMRSLLAQSPVISQIREASNGHEAIQIVAEYKPDLIVMDYEMPNFNGIYATREIMKQHPDSKVIILSAHFSGEHIMEGIYAGIQGFLTKESKTSELLEAITAIAAGDTWFKGEIAERITPSLINVAKTGQKMKSNGGLTNREREIVSMLASGLTPRTIAEKLSISKRTVEVHKSNVFKKLKINGISELIRYAIRQGIAKV